MGAFAYSEEDDTYSATHYEDDVPENVKNGRLGRLMALQQQISAEIEAEKVGGPMKVAAERSLCTGHFYDVLITGAEEFDLYGTTLS